jgi:nucleotide-binding universal stress UspA family protein
MRRILVAVDGSDNALRALDFAAQQAGHEPAAELHVLTVEPPAATYSAWEIYVTAESLRRIATERAKGVLDGAAARLASLGCRFELEQLTGDPAETIAHRASELDCESIVMGTHGFSALGILIMGSVAQKVLHHATVPVTLVK